MTLAERLARVEHDIAEACRAAGRPREAVQLVAASKGQPAAAVIEAARNGQRVFGENYAAEMRKKRDEIGGSAGDLAWHFIGRVQESNAKVIATAVLVHGIGSLEQARALGKRAERPIPVLLQLSLWGEGSKNGFDAAGLGRNLEVLREVPGVTLRGFMAMPPPDAPARAAFAAVRALRDRIAPDLPELSLGMSGDFCEAILEGATLVRIGTALFGPRPPKPT